MIRTCLVEGNMNELTTDIVWKMAMILGPAQIFRMDELHSSCQDAELLVLVFSVADQPMEASIRNYLTENAPWLRTKKVALIFVGAAGADTIGYRSQWTELLASAIVFVRNIIINRRKMDCFELAQLVELTMELKALRDQWIPAVPAAELKTEIESFLNHHNTCTLCSGYQSQVRGTPIEYIYRSDCLYLYSEGGEKFAHILLNQRVSAAVYDPYQNMNQLAGLQLTGWAEIVPWQSAEYQEILKFKGLQREKIRALPFLLHLIKIKLLRAEFLWSGYQDRAVDLRQVYRFAPQEHAADADFVNKEDIYE